MPVIHRIHTTYDDYETSFSSWNPAANTTEMTPRECCRPVR